MLTLLKEICPTSAVITVFLCLIAGSHFLDDVYYSFAHSVAPWLAHDVNNMHAL